MIWIQPHEGRARMFLLLQAAVPSTQAARGVPPRVSLQKGNNLQHPISGTSELSLNQRIIETIESFQLKKPFKLPKPTPS